METHSTLEFTAMPGRGITLHAATAGPADGPLVVLLHGFPEFWYGWRKQIRPLADAGLRVVAPDQRGYNLSEKPKGLAHYTLDALADDVVALIDATGRDRAAVVGHDWGGIVAWWLAMRNPERVSRVAVLNAPHPDVLVSNRFLKSPTQVLKSWYVLAFQLPWLPEAGLGRKHGKSLARSLRKTSRPGAFSDEDLEAYRRAWEQPGALTAMLNWYRAALRARPSRSPSPRVRVPALVLWGVNDAFINRQFANDALSRCDQGRLEFFEGATHWLHHEEPERVNRLLTGFLTADAGEGEGEGTGAGVNVSASGTAGGPAPGAAG
jgi:pimeloyl-ACP methyl ester carboxylesterase